jgi:hypothetical protein
MGAALLSQPDRIYDILTTLVKGLPNKPITCKVRCASLSISQPLLATNKPITCKVRCAFSDRILHSKMPLVSTFVGLTLLHACDHWHSSRVFTLLPADTVNLVQTLKVRILSTEEATMKLVKMIESTGVAAIGVQCAFSRQTFTLAAPWILPLALDFCHATVRCAFSRQTFTPGRMH